jgi:hypothetical protein
MAAVKVSASRHLTLFIASLLLSWALSPGCSSSTDKPYKPDASGGGTDSAGTDASSGTCSAKDEGKTETSGPICCSGGCGASVNSGMPRLCRGGLYKCEGVAPVFQKFCAYEKNACEVLTACAQTVGINKTEDLVDNGKAPELCCDLRCDGKKALYRVCKSGLKFECPAGAVPISRCKDPMTACQGLLSRYRNNGYKIPADML